MEGNSLETFVLPHKDILIKRLIAAGYSFAAWRMPNEEQSQLIISLESFGKLSDLQISEVEPGFMVNGFEQNHPVSPYYIKADIILKGEEIKIHPTVNDAQLDELREKLQEESIVENNQIKQSKFNPSLGKHTFIHNVEEAIYEIKQGTFEKVVLSRSVTEELPTNFSLWKFYHLLCESYPNAFCSLTFIPERGIWVGASPELLMSDNKEGFKTVALAGTKKLEENQSLSEIAWTQKEIEEQALVSRYIINCFKKIRLREFHEHGPKTVKAGNLAHLKTSYEVKYDEVSFEGLADQLLTLLHPTSAVCGMPIERAKPWIETHEDYDRELFAGFLGPVNFENSTDLFVNLRCAKISGISIQYFAGAGITEDSNPEKEFEETEIKINVLRSLVNNL